MHLVFVDDAKQRPSRPGFKGEAVGVGALCIPADRARAAERALNDLCLATGFPPGEEFKWSPDRGTWMRSNLVEDARSAFFADVFAVLALHDCYALVAIVDNGRRPATGQPSAEKDVIVLLLERVANRLKEHGETALLIADRPSGGRTHENAFVADCLAMLEAGTNYVQHNEIGLVLTSDSRSVRLLQSADVVASCITAYVSGEDRFSPETAARVLTLLPESLGRRGGYSVKLHPDHCFVNLYHWLFGDSHYVKFGSGRPLPVSQHQYSTSPTIDWQS
jgi:hypothetical protein